MGLWNKALRVASGGMLGGNKRGTALGILGGGLPMGLLPDRRRQQQQAVQPSQGALNYFGSFSPEDQANIRQSVSRNPNGLNDWYNNAVRAGSVPGAAALPSAMGSYYGSDPNMVRAGAGWQGAPAAASAALNAFGGGAQRPVAAAPAAQAAPAQPQTYGGFTDPYEQWKQLGRPGGTFEAWKQSQGVG